ncbi:MAG: dipeptide epimerase [Anaerolineaceae bacterium]|jgi:L-alanine-DL-glutamate epimerase-like enolase superfamily enzyme|nr:dipeptide epimerase [Anaerolineaceae bacterium]MDD4042331.1 dipeptide epimerase [Anaerolineaceae bacterium]MDD4578915.1 dipeptide epimerase [Anaerolineaceae bacterium]
MKITKFRIAELQVPLKKPFKTALRSVEYINDVVVEIHTDEGLIGYGEAAPTVVITGDSKGGIIAAIRDHIASALIGQSLDAPEKIFEQMDAVILKNTSAKAAVDIALYDLIGQALGVPVYRLLGGYRESLETDLTISLNQPAEMAADGVEAVERGFQTLKVKLGKDPELDLRRLSTITDAVGDTIKFRLDANQGWTPKEAVRILRKIEDQGFSIEFVEQPVAAHDYDGLKYVTDNTPFSIMADESLFSPADALKLLQMRAVDLLNIKLMKCGGIHQALKICTLAEIYGVECMVGCMLETKLSVNAAAHLAAAKSIVRYVDLDGPGLCLTDPVSGGADFAEAQITLSQTPGLGIKQIESLHYLDQQ